MNDRLIIRPEAEADMAEQFDWYQERKQGLGYEFLGEVGSVLRMIEENPTRHAQIYRGVRRAFVRRFPFRVFYIFDAGNVRYPRTSEPGTLAATRIVDILSYLFVAKTRLEIRDFLIGRVIRMEKGQRCAKGFAGQSKGERHRTISF